MSDSEHHLALKAQQAALSRQDLAGRFNALEASFDVKGRVRREIASHPAKWTAVAAVGGLVTAKVTPMLLRLGRRTWGTRLLGMAASRLSMPIAATLVQSLAARAFGRRHMVTPD